MSTSIFPAIGLGILVALIILGIWDLIWRGMALWHSAQNKQKEWFIALLIINTAGILPIIYLLWFKPDQKKKRSRK
ncbi:hypothetical protein J4444_03595 [Candidatus Woesearchaeota archaeon]|nr:hypothetical protein [Candidatus Woesearchaeota archaeon]